MRALVHLHWNYTPSIIQMQQEFNQNFIEIIEWFPEKELKAEGVYVLLGWDWESFCQTESELLLLSLFGRTSRYWHTLWKYDPNAVLIKITAKWAGILTDIAIVIHYNVFNIQKIKQHRIPFLHRHTRVCFDSEASTWIFQKFFIFLLFVKISFQNENNSQRKDPNFFQGRHFKKCESVSNVEHYFV